MVAASRPGHTAPPLYDPSFEHDACGVGFVARVSGQQDHQVLVKALQAVANVTHRGAVDADAKTGDGSGVLTQLPRKLLLREAERRGFRVERESDLGLGMVFLPREDLVARDLCAAFVDYALRAREPELTSPVWGEAMEKLRPVVWEAGSDSASLDNLLELLELSGRDILHAMMMLVPSAWENLAEMDPRLREFYRYHACLTEPWDGPAALSFTDGVVAGAVLDRNGLRPSRYKVDEDG